MTTVTDPLGHTTTQDFDPVGNLIARTDANGHRSTWGYDVLDRPARATAPDATAVGEATTTAYDAVGRVTAVTDPLGHTTSYTYDLNGHLASKTTPSGHRWTYAYDADGNLTRIVTAIGNQAGNTQAERDAGAVSRDFDALDRLVRTRYGDGTPSVELTYDRADRISAMVDGLGTETRRYDAAGRPVEVSRTPSSGPVETFRYTYDAVGNIVRRTLPDGDVQVAGFDAAGQEVSLTAGGATTAYGYDATGRLNSIARPSGTASRYSYDRAGRLTGLAHAGGTATPLSFERTLDAVGNPLSVSTSRDGRTTVDGYRYDESDRLVEVCHGDATCAAATGGIRWVYDRAGRRVSERRTGDALDAGVQAATTTAYTYGDDDEVLSAVRSGGASGATTYAYDLNGRRVRAGAATSRYDLADRLVGQTTAAGTTSYGYDGAGNRRTATSAAGTTRYTWDGEAGLPVLVTAQAPSGLRTDYRYDPTGQPAQQVTGGVVSSLLLDEMGSVTAAESASGGVLGAPVYDPYGTVRSAGAAGFGTGVAELGYTGQLWDADAGLYDLRARQYDPAVGGFTSLDPLAAVTGQPYAYADGNPLRYLDPAGLCSWNVFGPRGAAHPGPSCFNAALNGAGDGLREFGVSVGQGVATLVTNPTKIERNLEQVYEDNGGGISGRAAVFNQFNPVYWGLTAGAASHDAWSQGDVRRASCEATKGTLQQLAFFAPVRGIGFRTGERAAANVAARTPSVIRVGELKLPGVPKGVTGTPTTTGRGLEYQVPRGTPELDPRVASIRVMDPVTTGKHQYPNGYVTYMNSVGQAVNPLTGRTLQPSDPLWHIELP